jgi:2-phosphoglycerate kinase
MSVFLIGGPPKCGKTTLAKVLSQRLNISQISADTLQNIARSYIDQKDYKQKFPLRVIKGRDKDETYSQNSSDTIIKAYIEQGKTSYEAISVVTETYLTDKDDFIIEGYQVTPQIVNQIINKYSSEKIRAVFLVKNDENKFVEDIYKSSTPNDWIINKTKNKDTFFRIAKMITDYSKYFNDEAKKYNFTVINMDHDFEAQIENAISFLLEKQESI